VMLARAGKQTALSRSLTGEEASSRPSAWIKQRSRWLKGYLATWITHMAEPVKLWRDLGAWRFFGVQLLFAGTISQFLLAPLLWSFWLMLAGVPHPPDGVLSRPLALTFAGIFLLSEVIGITVAALAVTATGKPDLIKWTPTLHLYFPLAALAAYKGVFELATRPFYWDKTAHGIFDATNEDNAPTPPPRPPLRQVSGE